MKKNPNRLPPLELLVSFEAAARHLSFTKAGAERFVTQSAISRQIQALEENLGVALFTRRHRALSLTADGQRLYSACTAMFEQLRTTIASIRAPARREVLALSTTPALASLWLIPRLTAFTKLHPEVDVRLDASFERRNLSAEGFDLAIRYGDAQKTEGAPLFGESMLPVCSPNLAKDFGQPLHVPSDLRRHTLLHVAPQADANMPLEWATWLQAVGLPDLQPAANLTFSAHAEMMTAAIAGQGVAIGRRPLVDELLRSRQLIAPFKDATASPRAYFLIVEGSSRLRPAVQAFEAWLLAQASGSSVAATPGQGAPAKAAQAQATSRSSRRKILPTVDLGKASMKRTTRGIL